MFCQRFVYKEQKIAQKAIFDADRSQEPSISMFGLRDDFRTLDWVEIEENMEEYSYI